jgi:hypothetical protein
MAFGEKERKGGGVYVQLLLDYLSWSENVVAVCELDVVWREQIQTLKRESECR